MENILAKWKELNVDFSAFYTGYVSQEQIPVIKKIMNETGRKGALKIVDPVMADNGKMYAGFAAVWPMRCRQPCRSMPSTIILSTARFMPTR